MPKFSNASEEKLRQCHPDLQRLFHEVVKGFDCKIDCGHRSEEDQNEAYRTNHSSKKFPESLHNSLPSLAVDVLPYPVDWDNLKRFYFFGGYVKRTAELMGIDVRWGGDWDGDTVLNDQKFMDLPHYEITNVI